MREIEALHQMDQVIKDKSNGNWELRKIGAYFLEIMGYMALVFAIGVFFEKDNSAKGIAFGCMVLINLGFELHMLAYSNIVVKEKPENQKITANIVDYLKYLPISSENIIKDRMKIGAKYVRNRAILAYAIFGAECVAYGRFCMMALIYVTFTVVLILVNNFFKLAPWRTYK